MENTTSSPNTRNDLANTPLGSSLPSAHHSETELKLTDSQKLLSMSKFMVKEMQSLSIEDKQQLEALDTITFSDFDATNDTHRNYINFLVEKMKSYKEYTTKHLKTIDTNTENYQTLLSTYCDVLDMPKTNLES